MAVSTKLLTEFRQIDESTVDILLKEEVKKNKSKIVVLDDDPTGVQTVCGVAVYTDWEKETILQAFKDQSRMFFILTNSRGFTSNKTAEVHREISKVIAEVAAKTGTEYMIVSRGDSTLRGHYPLETEILREGFEMHTEIPIDGEILCPFFLEGGRFTIGNVHYVQYGDELVPANETEFAEDATFGYQAPSLPDFIQEKTDGLYPSDQVLCISIDELRSMDLEQIKSRLMKTKDFQKIVVNAVSYVDLKIFCIALYRAMAEGKHFLFRTAASFVKVLGGIESSPLLSHKQLFHSAEKKRGVILVGSHTEKTTVQLEHLREIPGIEFMELDVSLVKDEKAFEKEVSDCLQKEEAFLQQGKTVCCYTSRTLFRAESSDKEEHLQISVKISDAVRNLVGKLTITPDFVIAKGGITSSDVGTKALNVKKAIVMGQIQHGVPVWMTGIESKFPGMPYVIFPGNVGQEDTLKKTAEILMGIKNDDVLMKSDRPAGCRDEEGK